MSAITNLRDLGLDPARCSDGYHTFDELYQHRVALFLALMRLFCIHTYEKVWISKKHADGTAFDGWFVAGIELPEAGQVSYYLPLEHWEAAELMGALVLDVAPFDGHTSDQVVQRLLELAAYHLPLEHWDTAELMGARALDVAPFDGHTSAQVIQRQLELACE